MAAGVSIWTISNFGRRPLLLWGFIGIAICHTLTATFILTKFNIGIILMICAFMAVYQNTTGPIAWVYAAETMTDVGLGVAL